jgi:DNA-binding LytR/AlgR family response regulator
MPSQMIKIAIVDDEKECILRLVDYLNRYAENEHMAFEISTFDNVVNFVDNFKGQFDIVFLDILMPYLNGVDAAHKLREKDANFILYFVTSTTQFAIKGYEVEATDYLVKPIEYYEFVLKISKAIEKLHKTNTPSITVKTRNGYKKLDASEIMYIEVISHHCEIHTTSGIYRQYTTIRSVESQLKDQPFARCNNCYLVNLAYASAIEEYEVVVGEDRLLISHPRKKEFLAKFKQFKEHKEHD